MFPNDDSVGMDSYSEEVLERSQEQGWLRIYIERDPEAGTTSNGWKLSGET